MTGKGDRPRSVDKKVFDKNFDDIDWSGMETGRLKQDMKGNTPKRIEPRRKIGRR